MWKDFEGLASKNIIKVFLNQLSKELDSSEEFLDNTELLKEYMATLARYKSDKKKSHIFEYHFINRLRDAVNIILEKNEPLILDAGSGLGTESLLFGLLGARVLAIDIHPVRAEIARKRKKWYLENVYSKLKIEFAQRDIIQFLKEIIKDRSDFQPDIVWITEAISHIYPPEDFLRLIHSIVKPNGKLIISESNLQNPIIWIKNWRDRAKRYKNMTKHEKTRFKRDNLFLYPWSFQDPATGKDVYICNEKLWKPYQLKNMLELSGFMVENINIHRFIPDILMSRKSMNVWSKVESYIKHIPLVSQMGIRQIIIASK